MTATFQSWGASYEWSWFFATIVGILVIALPLLTVVADAMGLAGGALRPRRPAVVDSVERPPGGRRDAGADGHVLGFSEADSEIAERFHDRFCERI